MSDEVAIPVPLSVGTSISKWRTVLVNCQPVPAQVGMVQTTGGPLHFAVVYPDGRGDDDPFFVRAESTISGEQALEYALAAAEGREARDV